MAAIDTGKSNRVVGMAVLLCALVGVKQKVEIDSLSQELKDLAERTSHSTRYAGEGADLRDPDNLFNEGLRRKYGGTEEDAEKARQLYAEERRAEVLWREQEALIGRKLLELERLGKNYNLAEHVLPPVPLETEPTSEQMESPTKNR